jgi:hypothetical protein
MRPASGTRLFFIGDEGVLFSEPRQELHAFNTTASVIWCHLEDGLPAAEIARELTAANGLGEAAARSHVEAALADWAMKGLIMNGLVTNSTIAGPMPLAPEWPVPDLPPMRDDGFVDVRDYRMLNVTVRIRFANAGDADLVHPLFAHLEYRGPRAPGRVVDIGPTANGTGFWCDAAPAGFCAIGEDIVPMAKGVVWTEVLRSQDYLLQIHAGVVGGPAGCVLLPAAPGSGKSTLTTALVHAGFDLFSDEVALLNHGDLTASPFPAAICVKDTGIETIARLYPQVLDLPLHRRLDGKRVVYLPPPADSVPAEGHRRAVCGIVFPQYTAGARTTLRRLGAAEALARLLTQCQNVGRPLDHAAIGSLVRWIDRMPSTAIEYGSMAPALALAGEILLGAPSANGSDPGV